MVAPSTHIDETNLSLDAVQAKAAALAREIRNFAPDLRVVFAVHRQGQLQNTLQMMEDSFLDHPAGRIAASIAGRGFPDHEPSAFHGLCAKRSHHIVGFNSADSYLAVISINVDEFIGFTTLLLDMYRQTWMALELTAFFRSKPNEKIPERPLNIKRNPLGEARVNLRADLFAVFMMNSEGYENILSETVYTYAMNSLTANIGIFPERYPFPLIAQTVAYALSDIVPHLSKDKSRLEQCSELTSELSASVDDTQLKLWIRFAETAQDMAWRGYKPETILGCAVHTSDDPFLRAIAHKVSEFSRIQPQTLDQTLSSFNGFIGIQDNYPIHAALIEQAFETALESSIEHGHSDPFFKIARLQNESLLQGRFIGWCASALQNAGRVYREANATGIPPAEAARIEFESLCYLIPLSTMHKLGKTIVLYRKDGHNLTFDDMISIVREQGDVDQIAQSYEYLIYGHRDQQTPVEEHAANEDISLEGIDPDKLYQRITQFTRLSTDPAPIQPVDDDKKKSNELSLEED